jgi:hypothetical protein
MVLRLIGLCAVLACATACRDREGRLQSDAGVVVGTAIHEVVVHCVAAEANTVLLYRCRVQSPTGVELANGYFELVGGRDFTPDNVHEYVGFDGRTIRLTRGRALQPHEPPRSSRIPADAAWAGGITCGVFIGCVEASDNIYDCARYDAASGAELSRRHYRLHGSAADVLRDPVECGIGNAGRIYLANRQSYLEPLGDAQ